MRTKDLRPYLRISTPDEKYFVWIKRPDSNMRSYLMSNIESSSRFADMLDELPYLTVERIHQLDEEMSSIIFSLSSGNASECINQLIDDIPNIMYSVINEQTRS